MSGLPIFPQRLTFATTGAVYDIPPPLVAEIRANFQAKAKARAKQSEDVEMAEETPAKKTLPPKTDEYLWMWKVHFTFDVSLECAADDMMCTAGAGDNEEDVLFVVSLQYLVSPILPWNPTFC